MNEIPIIHEGGDRRPRPKRRGSIVFAIVVFGFAIVGLVGSIVMVTLALVGAF
jgi:hypothetical protein